MRILFITSSRIGDAVISCGILEHLRQSHPHARITVACGAVAEGVFSRLPGLEQLIVFEKQRFDLHWLKLWTRLIPYVWDIVVDVRGSAMALLLLAKKRHMLRGGRRPGRRYEQLATGMGFDPPPLPVTWVAPADTAKAANLLPDNPVIGLGPTANWSGKIWPAENFIALFKALATGPLANARPAIFAGPGAAERTAAAPVLAALPGAIDLVGSLTLPEVSACLGRCALFVGNDSGLMHLAAASGTPTLGLFGRSRADEYAPAGLHTAIAVAPGPAGEAPMEGLTVAAALAAARRLL
ncbi:MAG: glycosyltransferase family 9 protein [Acidocella sp.]|nr:glycosyltransferase family 9 protein [Acidocella sp.]